MLMASATSSWVWPRRLRKNLMFELKNMANKFGAANINDYIVIAKLIRNKSFVKK